MSITKENLSILETHEELVLNEWNYEKNNKLQLYPNKITRGSHKKAWWKCIFGHDFLSSIKSRCSKGSGCPECYKERKSFVLRKAKSSKNSISFNAPQSIKEEWDYEENKKHNFFQEQVSCGSQYKVYWVCSKNKEHKWSATPENRIRNSSGCPFCSRNQVCYENSIEYLHPDILDEWDYERNILKPSKVSPGSTKELFWKCKNFPKDHLWSMSPNKRQKNGGFSGCPYCSGQKVNHTNHLFITHPHLEKEWNYEKNKIDPTKIRFGTRQKAWWICPKGHEYKTQISNRTVCGSGCPECYVRISKGHQELIELLSHYREKLGEIKINDRETIRNPKTGFPLELDIFLPKINTAFEFNGSYYHSEKFCKNIHEKHNLKTKLCDKKGIRLIHIDEESWYKEPEKYEILVQNL